MKLQTITWLCPTMNSNQCPILSTNEHHQNDNLEFDSLTTQERTPWVVCLVEQMASEKNYSQKIEKLGLWDMILHKPT